MDPVQVTSYVVNIVSLGMLIFYAVKNRRNRWAVYPIAVVCLHTILFYTCVIFFPGENFSFTHWSRWLRVHEGGTFFLVLLGLLIQRWQRSRVGTAGRRYDD